MKKVSKQYHESNIKPIVTYNCAQVRNLCKTCGEPLHKSSMVPGHFVCSGNTCDSKITTTKSTGYKAIRETYTRTAYKDIAFPVAVIDSKMLFESKFRINSGNAVIFYSPTVNVPLVARELIPIGKENACNKDRLFPFRQYFYLAGTHNVIELFQLPEMSCGEDFYEIQDVTFEHQIPKRITWPEICNKEHKEPEISWRMLNRYVNPKRFVHPELIEKICQNLSGGKLAWSIPPEEWHRLSFPKLPLSETKSWQNTEKLAYLLQ